MDTPQLLPTPPAAVFRAAEALARMIVAREIARTRHSESVATD